jgi:glycosyltransferase involved in cell wall biosynthesis
MENRIYIVDKKHSALYIAASSRVALSGGKILISNEYKSPRHLLRTIYKEKGGIVLFCWRKALADVISLNSSLKLYKKFDDRFTFAFLIPDHMGLETEFGNIEAQLIKSSEYYVVTSKILFNQYSAKYPTKPPMAIFHDLPNLELIENIRKNFKKSKGLQTKAIWVGNSKWGRRQGYKDHKGFKECIEPLRNYCEKHITNLTIEIIDSSKKNLSQRDTLKRIRESDVLLQTSKNEGTGIVVLEAIGLGTHVLTTKVGIAGEFFSDDDSQILKDKSILGIVAKIRSLNDHELTENIRVKYDKYVVSARNENLVSVSKTREFTKSKSGLSYFKVYVYWIYRYVHNKLILWKYLVIK